MRSAAACFPFQFAERGIVPVDLSCQRCCLVPPSECRTLQFLIRSTFAILDGSPRCFLPSVPRPSLASASTLARTQLRTPSNRSSCGRRWRSTTRCLASCQQCQHSGSRETVGSGVRDAGRQSGGRPGNSYHAYERYRSHALMDVAMLVFVRAASCTRSYAPSPPCAVGLEACAWSP